MTEWFKNLSEGWQIAIFGAGITVIVGIIQLIKFPFKKKESMTSTRKILQKKGKEHTAANIDGDKNIIAGGNINMGVGAEELSAALKALNKDLEMVGTDQSNKFVSEIKEFTDEKINISAQVIQDKHNEEQTFRLEKEFQLYGELWKALNNVRSSIIITPTLDRMPKGKSPYDVYKDRYDIAIDAYNKAKSLFENNRPFYHDAVSKIIKEFLGRCRGYIFKVQRMLRTEKFDDRLYDEADELLEIIPKTIDEIEKEIKVRIGLLPKSKNMNKNKKVNILQKQLDQISNLKSKSLSSSIMQQWIRDTKVAIEKILGPEKKEEFGRIDFCPQQSYTGEQFTEANEQESFINGLAIAEVMLQSMIKECENWPDSITTTINNSDKNVNITRYDRILYKIKNNKIIIYIKNHRILAPLLVVVVISVLLFGYVENLKPIWKIIHNTDQTKNDEPITPAVEKRRSDSIYDMFTGDPNMPKRSNEFQSLITKIQAALHGKNAKVQESAMIYNYDTESETEIDILITYNIGGSEYKTAIECQDRSRPAGAPWIAELKAKREGCRIDKIIAIHANGFTASAKTLAERYNIETLTPTVLDEINILSTIVPYKKLAFQTIFCKLPEGIRFDMLGQNPEKAEATSSYLLFQDNNEISVDDFQNEIRKIIRHTFEQQYILAKTDSGENLEDNEVEEIIETTIIFPNLTYLKPTRGSLLVIEKASANAIITVKTIWLDFLEYISLKEGVLATHVDFELMGKKASITLTQQEGEKNKMGICIYWEGGQINGPETIDKRLLNNIEIFCKKGGKNI